MIYGLSSITPSFFVHLQPVILFFLALLFFEMFAARFESKLSFVSELPPCKALNNYKDSLILSILSSIRNSAVGTLIFFALPTIIFGLGFKLELLFRSLAIHQRVVFSYK
jgi:hypothetical protein